MKRYLEPFWESLKAGVKVWLVLSVVLIPPVLLLAWLFWLTRNALLGCIVSGVFMLVAGAAVEAFYNWREK